MFLNGNLTKFGKRRFLQTPRGHFLPSEHSSAYAFTVNRPPAFLTLPRNASLSLTTSWLLWASATSARRPFTTWRPFVTVPLLLLLFRTRDASSVRTTAAALLPRQRGRARTKPGHFLTPFLGRVPHLTAPIRSITELTFHLPCFSIRLCYQTGVKARPRVATGSSTLVPTSTMRAIVRVLILRSLLSGPISCDLCGTTPYLRRQNRGSGRPILESRSPAFNDDTSELIRSLICIRGCSALFHRQTPLNLTRSADRPNVCMLSPFDTVYCKHHNAMTVRS